MLTRQNVQHKNNTTEGSTMHESSVPRLQGIIRVTLVFGRNETRGSVDRNQDIEIDAYRTARRHPYKQEFSRLLFSRV